MQTQIASEGSSLATTRSASDSKHEQISASQHRAMAASNDRRD
jgi:hypothetical protein